ncbi:MAG TPA: hypothetical protein VFW19_03105 [Allosphingosinicella sp.]|nr:hypothetical protein [Allosphingosinicella sp.]
MARETVPRSTRRDGILNAGRPEIFLYATGPSHCGSRGCDLYILSSRAKACRVVMRSSVTQLPVRLLATSHRGWRDVGVTVSGGGIRGPYMARLRFDGRLYPENPTLPPAEPMKHPSGRVPIAAPTLRR